MNNPNDKRDTNPQKTYGTSIISVSDREDEVMGMGKICEVKGQSTLPGSDWRIFDVMVQSRPWFTGPVTEVMMDEVVRDGKSADVEDPHANSDWAAQDVPDFQCGFDNAVVAVTVFENDMGETLREPAKAGPYSTCDGCISTGPPPVIEEPLPGVEEMDKTDVPKLKFTLTDKPRPNKGEGDLRHAHRGHRLQTKDGNNLMAGQVTVYAKKNKVDWTPGGQASLITDPAGNGQVNLRDYRWAFRTGPQYSVTLFQIGERPHVITAREKKEAQTFRLNAKKPVYLQVNQRRDQYAGNTGRIEIVVEPA